MNGLTKKRVVQRLASAFLVLGIATLSFVPTPAPAQAPAAAPARKVFANSVIPLPLLPVHVAAAEASHDNDTMQVLFSLPIPPDAKARLEAKVARGEVVSPQELERDYSANAADADKLVAWLTAQGFDVTHITPNHTSVYARATVAQISKSLDVLMARVTRDGITYNAARNAPSLPSDVGGGVHAIVGLQPFRHAYKNSRMRTPSNGNRASLGSEDEQTPTPPKTRSFATPRAVAPTPTTNIANSPPYLVREILRAYNGESLGLTGAGQTIAILIDTFPADADLKKFWKVNRLPESLNRIEKINVQKGTLPAMEGEETLDAQWTSGIAPEAKIRIYASGSLNFPDLDLALDQIIADLDSERGMRQLSISLGLGETFMGSADGEVSTQNQKFLILSAAGVNVFVSTGDAGSNPDDTGHSSGGPLQAEFQSTSPHVVAVGGTSLTLNPAGSVAAEVGWADGGGGKSIFFSRPPSQSGTGVPTGTERLVPDVSSVADPDTGALIIFQGKTQQIGGTSWSAPTWAGICALMNEARTKAGKQPLPFLNPIIYPVMSSGSFRDITKGSNGAFSAGIGYDLVTGIGVPDLKALAEELKSK